MRAWIAAPGDDEGRNIRLVRGGREADADRAARDLRRLPHRLQRRGSPRSCRTSRPSPPRPRSPQGRTRSPASRLKGRGTAKSVVFGSRSAPAPMILRLRRDGDDLPLELVAQAPQSGRRIPEMVTGEPRRNAEPRHCRDVFGAGAPPPLLPAAGQKRLRPQCSSASTSAPAPCGPPILWAERARKSTPSAVDVDRDAPERLHRVAEDIAAVPLHDPRGLGDRMDDAGLVVGEHQRDSRARRARHHGRQAPLRARRGRSSPSRSTGSRLTASAGKRPPASTQGCSVAPDIEPARPGRCVPGPTGSRRQRQHGGLGCAAGEDHVLRLCADGRGYFRARRLQAHSRAAALGMHGGRVRAAVERRDHGLARFRQEAALRHWRRDRCA